MFNCSIRKTTEALPRFKTVISRGYNYLPDLIQQSFFLIIRMFIFVVIRFYSLKPSIFENPYNEKPDLFISHYNFSVI